MNEVSVAETCSENNLSWFRIIKILLAVIVGLVILLVIFIPKPISRERADRIKCMANMRNLGIAFYIYAQDNSNSYPTPEKWCDLLIMNYEVKLDYLVCRGSDAKIGESSYAFNKSVVGKKSSEVPQDTVLLFETNFGKDPLGRDGTLGDRDWYKSLSSLSDRSDLKKHKHSEKVYKLRWNQFCGSELLTTENHKGEGCNVLFNDWHAEFVKAERLGELKWGAEEKDSESIEKEIDGIK